MAEEFGVGEGIGQRGAVDGDEGAIGARALLVEPAGEDGFAGAGFALDEDGRKVLTEAAIGLDDGFELCADGRERVTEEEFGGGWSGGAVLVAAIGTTERAAASEGEREFFDGERFGEVVAGAEAHGCDGGFDAFEGRHDDDAGGFGKRAGAEEIEGVAVGQVKIDQGEIEAERVEKTASFGERGGFADVGVELAEMSGEAFAENGVVVEHENSATPGKGGLEEHAWGGAVWL